MTKLFTLGLTVATRACPFQQVLIGDISFDNAKRPLARPIAFNWQKLEAMDQESGAQSPRVCFRMGLAAHNAVGPKHSSERILLRAFVSDPRHMYAFGKRCHRVRRQA